MFPFQHDEVVRFMLPGGVAVLAFLFLHPPSGNLANVQVGGATLLILFVLVLGNLIFGLHRALLYRLLFAFLLFWFVEKGAGDEARPTRKRRIWSLFLTLFYFPEAERIVTLWEWRQHKGDDPLWQNLGRSSVRIHFLYCCAWAIVLALVLARYGAPYSNSAPSSSHVVPILWYTALGCFWGAFISDWRWMSLAYNEGWTRHGRSYLLGSKPIVIAGSQSKPTDQD